MRENGPVQRGVVTRVTSDGAFVEVPVFAPGNEFGPIYIPVGMVLVSGDNVIVAAIDNIQDDLEILSGPR